MKLLAVVEKDLVNGRACARVDYTGTFPLLGEPPRPGLVELDCPGLAQANRAALLKWLATEGERVGRGAATGASVAGALDAVPSHLWRVISYGEAVALPNFDGLTYLAAAAAPLAEISACLAERMPALLQRIEEALALPDVEQIRGLRATHADRKTVPTVVWGLTSRADTHITELSERVDREALAQLLTTPFDVTAWVAAAAAMRADSGRVEALVALVRRIPDGDDAPRHAEEIIAAVSQHRALVRATTYGGLFWNVLAPLLAWPATRHGGELGIEDATEVVVTPSWDLRNGVRVGRIKPGRKALQIPGKPPTFVRGTRALLKQVVDAGGSLRHHGVTLTYPTDARPLTPRLIEVERADTLAYVDPDAALALLGDRATDPALVALAARAKADPGAARVLADYVIELTAGIDADVARKLARGRR
ncbi:MAG: hypothetical protein IPG81_24440 [Sandaracinaceae bacterium]|nr:hypothetical protein [Sandaracinaceae bacterium]